MHGMPLAEPAILLGLHPVGMSLLILSGIVVTVLALRAGKCDPCTHSYTSALNIMKKHLFQQAFLRSGKPGCIKLVNPGAVIKYRTKKRRPQRSPMYSNIRTAPRQHLILHDFGHFFMFIERLDKKYKKTKLFFVTCIAFCDV